MPKHTVHCGVVWRAVCALGCPTMCTHCLSMPGVCLYMFVFMSRAQINTYTTIVNTLIPGFDACAKRPPSVTIHTSEPNEKENNIHRLTVFQLGDVQRVWFFHLLCSTHKRLFRIAVCGWVCAGWSIYTAGRGEAQQSYGKALSAANRTSVT